MNFYKRITNKKFDIALISILILLFLTIIPLSLFNIVKVSGLSMFPVLNNKDILISFKYTSNYERGDIVIFDNPDSNDVKCIKRIIGLPIEHIQIKNNIVKINGKTLKEDYIFSDIKTKGDIDIIIPENEYFLLGDYRSISNDSRFFGTIHINDFDGKVILKVF